MSKLIENYWRVGSVFTLVRELMNANPKLGYSKAKSMAGLTKRVRTSRYKTHYGSQAAARNKRHALAGTHGLQMGLNSSIVFG